MRLAHKALVKVVYPKAVCHKIDGAYEVYDKPQGRLLGRSESSWRAWAIAYGGFSRSMKRKASAGY